MLNVDIVRPPSICRLASLSRTNQDAEGVRRVARRVRTWLAHLLRVRIFRNDRFANVTMITYRYSVWVLVCLESVCAQISWIRACILKLFTLPLFTCSTRRYAYYESTSLVLEDPVHEGPSTQVCGSVLPVPLLRCVALSYWPLH